MHSTVDSSNKSAIPFPAKMVFSDFFHKNYIIIAAVSLCQCCHIYRILNVKNVNKKLSWIWIYIISTIKVCLWFYDSSFKKICSLWIIHSFHEFHIHSFENLFISLIFSCHPIHPFQNKKRIFHNFFFEKRKKNSEKFYAQKNGMFYTA